MEPTKNRPDDGAADGDSLLHVFRAAMEPTEDRPDDQRLGLALAEVGPAAMEPAKDRPDDVSRDLIREAWGIQPQWSRPRIGRMTSRHAGP